MSDRVSKFLKWRVGDSKRFSIWKDPWLRDSINSYVARPVPVTEDWRVSNLIHGILQPVEALCQAMRWVCDLGFHQVIFESDCKAVVDSYNSHCTTQSEVGAIISLCKDRLSTYFANMEICFH